MQKDKKNERRPLTPREIEVIRYVAEGYKNKDIAEKLGIQIKTVETHRTQVMERLNIHDIAGLTRFAIRVGLIKTDA